MSACFLLIIFFLVCFVLLLLKNVFWSSGLPDLHNKHVLITGGSSGIGKSAAIEAAKLGAHVTIIARDKIKLEAAVEEIKNAAESPNNQKVNQIALNVTESYNIVEKTVASIEADVGPIFLLINCAGSAVCGEIDNATEADFKYMMDLNYFGTVFITLAVARKMKERNEGHIVITGSQASLLGIYGMSAYCSSKFALRGFAESLHMELQPFNVSVTLSLPPDTNTPGFESEEKSKPDITKLISETAGLFEPVVVARQLLSDALNKKFFSTVGFESLILTTLCAGMSPIGSWPDVFLQILSMSFLRLISVGYLLHFRKLIFKNFKTLVSEKSNLRKDD